MIVCGPKILLPGGRVTIVSNAGACAPVCCARDEQERGERHCRRPAERWVLSPIGG
jgi:hypothetical protein